MKEIFALILALIMILSFTACSGDNNTVADGKTDSLNNIADTDNSFENNSQDSNVDISENTNGDGAENTNGSTSGNTSENTSENTSGNIFENATGNTPANQTTTHTHSYSSQVTVPTCTTVGYTTYTCTCGHLYTADFTGLKNHSYSQAVTAATSNSFGYTTYTCSCGYSYTANYTIPKIDKEFIVGETLTCPVGSAFSLPINGDFGDIATITTLKVTKQKEADINNPDDWWRLNGEYYAYYRYIYNVKINGKVDQKYVGKKIYIRLQFESYEEFFGVGVPAATINSDGTFQFDYLAYSNKIETAIIPHSTHIN